VSPASDPRGPSAGSHRVLRGGSWDDDAFYFRATYRDYNLPEDRDDIDGFRSVLPTGQP
jgi:formylglycine-generating enzyme required for sulfatase activity